jgi:isocitrate lyase
MSYKNQIAETSKLIAAQNGTWDSISPESVARMQLQNRFQTGLDIARYTAEIMRAGHGSL